MHEGAPDFNSALSSSWEALKKMDMADYAKVRQELLGKAEEWREQEVVQHTCMWCGAEVSGDIDAHEAECGG